LAETGEGIATGKRAELDFLTLGNHYCTSAWWASFFSIAGTEGLFSLWHPESPGLVMQVTWFAH